MADLHDWGTGAAPKPPRCNYAPKYHIFPQTLHDLMRRAGPYGNAAKIHREWGAVTVWMMKEGYDLLSATGLPAAITSLSVILIREAEEHTAEWPRLSGPVVTPAIYGYSEDCQYEARRIAAEVYAIWEGNGRPYLRPSDCKDAFQYLAACVDAGIIPPIPTMGDIEPSSSAKPAKPHILDMFKETQ